MTRLTSQNPNVADHQVSRRSSTATPSTRAKKLNKRVSFGVEGDPDPNAGEHDHTGGMLLYEDEFCTDGGYFLDRQDPDRPKNLLLQVTYGGKFHSLTHFDQRPADRR